jgi:hypothetical protein
LEVLILRDFKSLFPEVLILIDFKSLSPEVLILVDLKSLIISRIQNCEKFLEVLILESLVEFAFLEMLIPGGLTARHRAIEGAR